MKQNFSPETIQALATLREAVQHSDEISNRLARTFKVLDDGGVFSALDEQTDYASAEDILAESALSAASPVLDPAEWGDTTQADIALHQGLTQAQAVAMFDAPVDEPLHGKAADEVRDALKYDRCPNGNTAPECTEIDPCEPCAQDADEEGDRIEQSMGLRD